VSLGMRMAFQRARRHQDLLSLATLAVVLVTFFQWLNGGNYAIAPLPWLLLGWLDRPRNDAPPERLSEEGTPTYSPLEPLRPGVL
jgi:hypothetical protein